MQLDNNRIEKYLNEIVRELQDINNLLTRSDEDILQSPHLIKSLKYSIIIIAGTLQHILAKKHKVTIQGYTEVFLSSKEHLIISSELSDQLQPFFRFRNMLVHGYWRVDNRLFLENIRNGLKDFRDFVKQMSDLLSEEKPDESPK